MKKYLFFFVLIFASFSFYFLNRYHNDGKILGIKKNTRINKITPTPTALIMPENTIELSKGEKIYWITWIKVEDKEKLFLYPNFTDKESARNLIDKKKCKILVNGSYYTKDDKPLGLFLSENISLAGKTISTLMPVIFYISADNKEIGFVTNLPENKTRIALQVGPVLIENGKAKKLSIRQDSLARRMMLAITEDKELIFLAAYGADTIFEGPYLSDLPELLLQFREKTDIKLSDVVNLDGGSASAFYDGKFFLEELSYIGSYFCVL